MYYLLFLLLCLPSLCHSFYSVDNLSLEEQIGQILICHFEGKEANEDAKELIQELCLGGIIYYTWANSLSSPQQIFDLSSQLQKLRKPHLPPLFIATDQEGGIVNRLSEGFTVFPGNAALGSIQDPELARQAAYAMGKELRAVGINMNLAPVVDVASNPYNPVIGIRSFGSSVKQVISLGKKTIEGYHQAQVLTTLKHFPGHGDVSVDPHKELPFVNKSREELEQVELCPFKELSLDTDAVMTAHLKVPSLDPHYCATLSKDILEILRIQYAFQGLIISDSLLMEGVLKECFSLEEASLQAFNAGCDVLLLGGKHLIKDNKEHLFTISDVKKVHAYLVEAAKTGKLSQDRLKKSVQRILDVKARNNLLPSQHFSSELFCSEEVLAKKIASLAIQILKKPSIASLEAKKIALFAPRYLEAALKKTFLLKSELISPLFFKTFNPTQEEVDAAFSLKKTNEVIIFCCYNVWKNPQQTALIHSLIAQNHPVILFVLGSPIDATFFPEAAAIVVSFSPGAFSIQAAYDALF